MATINPPIKILELKKSEYTGSEEVVEGSLIEPTKEVKIMYPITRKGRSLPHPGPLGRLLGI
ncbi:MAG TPA: hypothetical protein HA367_09840 [Candidatus Methanofastidiosum sp.]|nr:hypothetical protein [Methanofastidiosum sp.]